MQAKKILLPVDFSTAGEAALKMATMLARDGGGTLIILHVEEPPMAYGGGELYYGLVEPDRTELSRMLHEIKPSDPSIPVVYRLVTGDPATSVVQAAEEEGVDFIVVGSHGRTGLGRLLMGSVAESIVRHAKCPVVTVKAPAPAPKKA
ncbi:Putative universal stress protein [Anatilimnocola aggregata]|uniref:Universal stress protein n=1 Tax=Anatilimnocola aggregata TaxID=2528021 RepID=A0A517YHI4_9BACT|nr:universal stress protein [Anatilimnocola aggregata]QDU29686.1 Putative universal stress protein [Anatilimnocola aggregata]